MYTCQENIEQWTQYIYISPLTLCLRRKLTWIWDNFISKKSLKISTGWSESFRIQYYCENIYFSRLRFGSITVIMELISIARKLLSNLEENTKCLGFFLLLFPIKHEFDLYIFLFSNIAVTHFSTSGYHHV